MQEEVASARSRDAAVGAGVDAVRVLKQQEKDHDKTLGEGGGKNAAKFEAEAKAKLEAKGQDSNEANESAASQNELQKKQPPFESSQLYDSILPRSQEQQAEEGFPVFDGYYCLGLQPHDTMNPPPPRFPKTLQNLWWW